MLAGMTFSESRAHGGTTLSKPVLATAMAAALVYSLSGCGENPTPEPTIGGSSSPAAAETSGSATPKARAVPTTYPAVGLEFTSLPSEDDVAPEVIEAFVRYERGISQMTRTARMNTLLTDTASGQALATQRETAGYLQENAGRYSGTVVVDVEVERADDRLVALGTCEDASGLRLTERGKPVELRGPDRTPVRVLLTRVDGTWKVTEYTFKEGSC